VITRKQFVNTASVATKINQAAVSNTWESYWWVFVKGYHVLEYTILMLLLVYAFDEFKRKPWAAGLASLGYAATDEWHQTFVPHRGGHISDVLIDGIGIVLALAIIYWFRKAPEQVHKS
jgi:VanZ family protein